MFSCAPSQVSAAWLCYLNWPSILLNSTSPGNAYSGLKMILGTWRMSGCSSVVLIIIDAEGSDSHTCRLGERWSLHQCGVRWWWQRSYPSSYIQRYCQPSLFVASRLSGVGMANARPDMCPQRWCGLVLCLIQPLRTSPGGVSLNVQCRWVHALNM